MVGNFSDDLDESLDTSEHALRFKWSAVNAGYVQDDFIKYFVTDRNRGPSYNIIHFLRIASVRLAIQTFIEQFPNEKVQVVNLGCGFDTIALWILQQYKHVTCFDIDLPNLLQRKAQMMRNAKEIMNLFLGYNDIEEEYIVTENYKMVPIDLNNIEELETLPNKYGLQIELVLKNKMILCSQPTVFLSELVLVYLSVEQSNKIINFASDLVIKPSCFIYWEQARMDDPMGQMILQRFQALGYELQGPSVYKTIESQIKRYTELGWQKVVVMDMTTFYNELVADNEKQRIRKLECLDDVEEIAMVCSHYVIGICGKQPEEYMSLFDSFTKETTRGTTKTYTTEEMLEMIKNGTLSQMQPAPLKTDGI